MERGASEWRSGTLRKEQGIKKEARGSSRATSQSCSSFSEGRAFTCRTSSVAPSGARRVVGWPGGRAKSRQRQSGRDETLTNPDVRIGSTNTDASSASEDVSQSVETRLLRLGMAPGFSNVVIRSSLAGVRRDRFLPDRFANSPAGRVKPHGLTAMLLCFDVRGDPKNPDKHYTTSN
jgi:hypothetical protein